MEKACSCLLVIFARLTESGCCAILRVDDENVWWICMERDVE